MGISKKLLVSFLCILAAAAVIGLIFIKKGGEPSSGNNSISSDSNDIADIKEQEHIKEQNTKEQNTKDESTSIKDGTEDVNTEQAEDKTSEEASENVTTSETTGEAVYEDIDFCGQRINQGVTDADISNFKITDFDRFKEDIKLFPKLSRIVMCDCGLTNGQMEELITEYPAIKFVWKVYLGEWSLRTDSVAFSTLKMVGDTYRLTDEDASVLKYCTELVALDIGHSNVHDISFLQYMPNLKILILVDQYDGTGMALKDMSYLKYTPNLMYLEFFVNQVSDLSFLQYLPKLVDLNVSYNPISDPEYLLKLPNTIERLFLEHTKLSAEDCEKIKAAYPNAQVEYIGEGSIDHGWREHPRYFAMIDMYYKNYVNDLFK